MRVAEPIVRKGRDPAEAGAAGARPFNGGPCGDAQPHRFAGRRWAAEQADRQTFQVAPRMVTLWRGRFLELGIEGLLKDAPRPGRRPTISSK